MKKIIFSSIILITISFVITLFLDRKTYIYHSISNNKNITISYDKDVIECNKTINDDIVEFEITPIKKGKTKIIINDDDKSSYINIYVHTFNIVTTGSFIGHFNGDILFIISFYIISILIITYLINKYRKSIKENLYSYKNARLLGLIIFILVSTMINLFIFIYDLRYGIYNSINGYLYTLQEDMYLFLIVIFPLAFILTILVTISNIKLLIKEGKTWKNMLGIILGNFILISTIIMILYVSINSYNVLILIIGHILTTSIIYLECIFFGTVFLGIKCAKKIPSFNKDAIIILGCQINNDGTLTNILKLRVDRAIEFANMQKQISGKDIIFVPSGGQGSDEIMSEAKAMKNYLIKEGINKDNILIEDKSTNTYENIKFSYNIIKEKIKNASIAYSTTNYHVFRTGIIANNQNIKLEGIGSKTKMYYWVNAFIREFIATLVSEKKSHIKTLLICFILIIFIVFISYN